MLMSNHDSHAIPISSISASSSEASSWRSGPLLFFLTILNFWDSGSKTSKEVLDLLSSRPYDIFLNICVGLWNCDVLLVFVLDFGASVSKKRWRVHLSSWEMRRWADQCRRFGVGAHVRGGRPMTSLNATIYHMRWSCLCVYMRPRMHYNDKYSEHLPVWNLNQPFCLWIQ